MKANVLRIVKNLVGILIFLLAIGYIIGLIPLVNEALISFFRLALAGLAIITVSGGMMIIVRIRRPGIYMFSPATFVDRYSQVDSIIREAKKGCALINVFGVTGIGITQLLRFCTDIVNGNIPHKYSVNYCKSTSGKAVIKYSARHLGYYMNVGSITCISDLYSIIAEAICNHQNEIHPTEELYSTLQHKMKSKKLIIFLDGIISRGQLDCIEEFALQHFTHRPQDALVIGTHQKALSYKLEYTPVEILKFDKNDQMILAMAHNIRLDAATNIKLYFVTEGIPLFAYILLKDPVALDAVCNYKHTFYSIFKEYILPSFEEAEAERKALEAIALASLSFPVVGTKELELIGGDVCRELYTLNGKGFIQYSAAKNEVIIPKVIAKTILSYSHTQGDLCITLFQHFKDINKDHYAILYLLLAQKTSLESEEYLTKKLVAWLNNNCIIELMIALEPSVDLATDVKSHYPSVYTLYIFACATAFALSGEYVKARKIFNDLELDGTLVRSYKNDLADRDFDMHFLWADIDHLLNSYNTAIDIIESLIYNSEIFCKKTRLTKLYWMKAHCLRHQAKDLNESLQMYKLCFDYADMYNQVEYKIRSIHGQICIAFITEDKEFDFKIAFSQILDIYDATFSHWDIYRFNTLKYIAIYNRIYENNKNDALMKLNESLKGYIGIGKRNIYDVYFEFGEYYRYYCEFEKSRDNYCKCISFAKNNSDYNLESLAELGLILVDVASNIQPSMERLIDIERKAYKKDLHLTIKYSRIIRQQIQKGEYNFTLFLFNP